jgi:hypothetical protein
MVLATIEALEEAPDVSSPVDQICVRVRLSTNPLWRVTDAFRETGQMNPNHRPRQMRRPPWWSLRELHFRLGMKELRDTSDRDVESCVITT